MITEAKRKKILELYKAGGNFKRISKQVKSDWRTVKKIVEAQKKKQDYVDDLLGTIPKDLAEAQNKRNKRRSEVLARMNSELPVSGRGIAIRTTEATIRKEAMELIEQLIKRLDTGKETTD